MVSPGIFTRELVAVDTTPTFGTTLPVIVGGASKGPVGQPRLLTSETDLITEFGLPFEDDYGLLSAVEYLKQGSQLFYLRVADSTVQTATTELLGPEGVRASGSVELTGNPVDGDSVTISDGTTSVTFEFDIATAATGTLTFAGQPTDGDTLTLDDGQNAATVFEFDAAAASTGDFSLSGQPSDGDTVQLIDAQGTTVTFEFDNNATVTGGNVSVTIGANEDDTLTNLFNAITSSALRITPVLDLPNDTIDLTQDDLGVAGDTTITVSGANLAKTDFTGGDDLVAAGSNVAVQLGTNAEGSIDNLVAAINGVGSTLFITATKASATLINLANDNVGAAGNVAITNSLTNVTETGMSGGANAGVGTGNVAVAVGGTAAATAQNLRNAITIQSGFNVTATISGAVVSLVNSTPGVAGNVAITESDSGGNISVTGMAGGTANGSTVGLTVSAISPGTWGNDLQIQVRRTTIAGAPAGNFDIIVRAPVGTSTALQIVEQFLNLSADSSSARFAETLVNVGVVNQSNPSSYITVSVGANQTPISGTYNIGATTAGTNGIGNLTSLDYIGSALGTQSTGLQTLRNNETVAFNLLAIPGVTDYAVILEAIDVCETRQDCLYVIDPPFGLSPAEVVDWHNGVSTLVANPPTAQLDTSFAVLYHAWVRVVSEYVEKALFLPPSGFVLAQYALTDRQVSPWRAPAGQQRGRLTGAIGVEYSPFPAERDLMLDGTNAVNPIVEFTGAGGIQLYGNETLQRTPSATDSIHIRRGLIDLKRQAVNATRDIQFEPNEPQTWRNVELRIQPLLDFLIGIRAIEPGARVVCNADTNPPALQALKTLNAKIFLTPIGAAEILQLDFVVSAIGQGNLTLQT